MKYIELSIFLMIALIISKSDSFGQEPYTKYFFKLFDNDMQILSISDTNKYFITIDGENNYREVREHGQNVIYDTLDNCFQIFNWGNGIATRYPTFSIINKATNDTMNIVINNTYSQYKAKVQYDEIVFNKGNFIIKSPIARRNWLKRNVFSGIKEIDYSVLKFPKRLKERARYEN